MAMGGINDHKPHAEWAHAARPTVWRLAATQHGVVSRAQLLERGLGAQAIAHRLKTGRLHRIHLGVYAIGRAEITREGRWMAAVLYCSAHAERAVLSHASAGALWGLCADDGLPEVTIPSATRLRPPTVRVHRAQHLRSEDIAKFDGIPVTTPIRTLVDLAVHLPPRRLEAAVNAADKLDRVDPERLRAALADRAGERGVPALRRLRDRHTFVLTDSELERRFLRLVRHAGLPCPRTGVILSGFKVDFHWPELGLVVETDGLRYHRTAAQQARDRRRDQVHAVAGLTTLRFTHAQVAFEPEAVSGTLASVARLTSAAARGGGP